MSNPTAFRFSGEFMELLRTWSFVTGKTQREILEDAFIEYTMSQPEMENKVSTLLNAMN